MHKRFEFGHSTALLFFLLLPYPWHCIQEILARSNVVMLSFCISFYEFSSSHIRLPDPLSFSPPLTQPAPFQLTQDYTRPFGMSPDSQFSLSFRDIISKSEVILKNSVKMGIPCCCCCCFPGCYPAFVSVPLSTRKPFNFYQTISSVTHLPVSES